MSKQGINRVILIGNLGNDPQTFTSGEASFTKIQLATSESWEQDGKKVTHVEWHTIVFFNGLAKVAFDYLKKGNKVYLEGKLRTRKWKDKDGVDRSGIEIIANEMQILNSRSNANEESSQQKQVVKQISQTQKFSSMPKTA